MRLLNQDDLASPSAMTGKVYKTLVLGDGFVGKTAIKSRFCEGTFEMDYKMTIGVNFGAKIFRYRNTTYALQIWDIAGQDRFKFLRNRFYAGAAGAVFVYDITNKLTFQNLENWIAEFQDYNETRPAVLVGNKTDLPSTGYIDPRTNKQYEKQVSFEEAQEFADSINAPLIEASAKENHHINEIFMRFVDCIEENRASNRMSIDSYKSISYGFEHLEDLIREGNSAKLFDGLLRLKQAIFNENPYSIVLGNINQWIEYIPNAEFTQAARDRLTQSKDAWRLYYKQSLREGQAVSEKI
jgi:small GTP-binding protein